MKKWFMAQSIVFKLAFAVACLAIVATVGMTIAINNSNNAPKQDAQVVDIADEIAPTTNAPVVTEPEVKQETETTTSVEIVEEKEETVTVVEETTTVEETEPVVEPVKVKTSFKLENGNFKEGLYAFQVYAVRDDYISYSTGNKGFSIDINDTGSEDWHVQLKQNDVLLEQGKWYKLTLDAKSDINRSIAVSMMRDGSNDDNWTSYANAKVLDLGKNWKTYTVVFCMNEKTDKHSVFNLAMGTVAGNHITKAHTVDINNIKLEELPSNFLDTLKSGDNLVANANFAYEDLLWEGSVVAPGAAKVSFANNKASFDITNPGTVDWHVQLKQSGIALENNTGYRLTFDVSSTVERIVKVGIMDTNYVNWYGGGDIYVPAGSKSVTVDFYNTLGNNSNAILMLSLGKIEGSTTLPGTVEISNVRLVKNNEVPAASANNGGGAAASSGSNAGLGDNWEALDFEGTHTNGIYRDSQGAIVAEIKNTGSEAWHVQLTNSTLKLEKGKTYKISFEALSTVDRDIMYMVQMNGGAYTPYSPVETVKLTGEWQPFELPFTMNEESDDAAVYNFSLGKVNENAVYETHTVKIRKITFEEINVHYPEKTEDGYIVLSTDNQVTEYGSTYWKVLLNAADYGLDATAIQRKTVTISATVKSNGVFNGQLGTCIGENWEGWVGNARTENYEAGEYEWSITAEDYQGSTQFQINYLEDGCYVEITNISMVVEDAEQPGENENTEQPSTGEEQPAASIVVKSTDEKITENNSTFYKVAVDPTKCGLDAETVKRKTVKISATIKADGEFNGQLGTCTHEDWSGWVDNNQSENYAAGEYEWEITASDYQGATQFQFFYIQDGCSVEITNLKMVVIEEQPAEKEEQKPSEEEPTVDPKALKTNDVYKFEGCPEELYGKNIRVTVELYSEKTYNGALKALDESWDAYKQYGDTVGSSTWTLDVTCYKGDAQINVYWAETPLEVVSVKFEEIKEEPAEDTKTLKTNDTLMFEGCPEELYGKNIRVTVELYSEKTYNGALKALDESWDAYKQYGDTVGSSTWTLDVTCYKGDAQLNVYWAETPLEVVSVKFEAIVEEQPEEEESNEEGEEDLAE